MKILKIGKQVEKMTKLRTYKLLKQNFGQESYFHSNISKIDHI